MSIWDAKEVIEEFVVEDLNCVAPHFYRDQYPITLHRPMCMQMWTKVELDEYSGFKWLERILQSYLD